MNLQSAYIYLVEGSAAATVTLADVKTKLQNYQEVTKKTGKQLGWDYSGQAFPYVMEEKPQGTNNWLFLKGKDPKSYKSIIIGVGSREVEGVERAYIQVSLPVASTHGDKGKANEFTRLLGKEFKGEAHLFNGRVQYFQPRKP